MLKSSHWSTAAQPISDAAMKFSGTSDRSQSLILARTKALHDFHSVVDFGTGVGRWLRNAMSMGIDDIRGYDIPEIDVAQRLFPADKFFPTDLSRPLTADRKFDLAISTEVAEHIPVGGAGTFIENLCRFSSVVLFSAAPPYQGGMGHVNENWLEYWAKLFARNGYDCYDVIRFPLWHETAIRSYYRQNIVLFAAPSMRAAFAGRNCQPTAAPISVIHPEQYIKSVNRSLPDKIKNVERDVQQYYECVYTGIDAIEAKSGRYHYGAEKLGFEQIKKAAG